MGSVLLAYSTYGLGYGTLIGPRIPTTLSSRMSFLARSAPSVGSFWSLKINSTLAPPSERSDPLGHVHRHLRETPVGNLSSQFGSSSKLSTFSRGTPGERIDHSDLDGIPAARELPAAKRRHPIRTIAKTSIGDLSL